MTDTQPQLTDQQIAEELKPLADTIRNAIEKKFILGDPIDLLVANITVAVGVLLGPIVRAERDATTAAADDRMAQALLAEADRRRTAEAQVAAAYGFADEMATYCSPHGVAADYAQRLLDRLNDAKAK